MFTSSAWDRSSPISCRRRTAGAPCVVLAHTVTAFDRRSSASRPTTSMPWADARQRAAASVSHPTTRMSSACASAAVCSPMRPTPTTPSVRPPSSTPRRETPAADRPPAAVVRQVEAGGQAEQQREAVLGHGTGRVVQQDGQPGIGGVVALDDTDVGDGLEGRPLLRLQAHAAATAQDDEVRTVP